MKNYTNNVNLTPYSQSLRKNQTPEEKRLWYNYLKKLPINVYRQKVLYNYIVDFYIAAAKLAIEVDGSQHRTIESQCLKDKERDEYLKTKGIRVLRIRNYDLNTNFSGICTMINHCLIDRCRYFEKCCNNLLDN